jgi:hypothetical protein
MNNITIISRPLALRLAVSAACMCIALQAHATPSAFLLQAQANWRSAIEALPPPTDGCFAAAFPARAWRQVPCVAAPNRPYLPRSAARAIGNTVGNGNDYSANSATITKAAVGLFPKITGLKTETGFGEANTYSLQLNSGFMNTAACNTGAPGCQSWQQFIYSSSEQAVFMQYWLIGYNTNGVTCPTVNWMSDGAGDCYINSNAISAPQFAATELSSLKVTGVARLKGNDSVTLTAPTKAYTVTGKDSVVDLATAWQQSEFNVVGDGGGSEAIFNTGTSITVEIKLNDGTTAKPTCEGNNGTTGETNNLKLGATCTTQTTGAPSIKFIESN